MFGYRETRDLRGQRAVEIRNYSTGERSMLYEGALSEGKTSSVGLLEAMIDSNAPESDITSMMHNIRDYFKNAKANLLDQFSGNLITHADGSMEMGGTVIPADFIAGLNGGASVTAFAAFIARLNNNPVPSSRADLFRWVAANPSVLLTNDGLVLGYRGQAADQHSIFSGYGEITPVGENGELGTTHYISNDHLPNFPGTVVSMPRECVNPDMNDSCSFGLHMGTFDYASAFSHSRETITINAFDPADVVVVPGGEDGKMRLCRYVVLGYTQNEVTPSQALTISTKGMSGVLA